MEFRGNAALAIMFVLLWGIAAAAQVSDLREIEVMMQDDTGMTSSVLKRAEGDASQVLRTAGIEVQWINCPKGSQTKECRHFPESNEFMLHVVRTGKTPNDLIFGEAFLGEGGIGKYADVFFDRIAGAEAESGVDFSELLGAVCAHELGHLLLGSRSHSTAGIMQAIWRRDALTKIGMGLMLFTGQESRTMRERLGQASLILSSIRVPIRNTVDGGF